MKFTIYGFSQERALEFRQEVVKNGKKSVIAYTLPIWQFCGGLWIFSQT